MKHTEIPWEVRQLLPDNHGIITKRGWEIFTPSYDVCASIENGAPIRKEADARFIVKACNNYQALVEAVRVALWDGEHNEYEAQKQGHPRMIERNEMYRKVLVNIDKELKP